MISKTYEKPLRIPHTSYADHLGIETALVISRYLAVISRSSRDHLAIIAWRCNHLESSHNNDHRVCKRASNMYCRESPYARARVLNRDRLFIHVPSPLLSHSNDAFNIDRSGRPTCSRKHATPQVIGFGGVVIAGHRKMVCLHK